MQSNWNETLNHMLYTHLEECPYHKETKWLQKMEKLGVISKVNEPTQWCARMVVVIKPSGKPRICIDLKPLNESVLWEVHPLPKVDITLAQLSGARVFSKLDTNSGFWQVPLAPQSQLLNTFLTPWGRYKFNKPPFGVRSIFKSEWTRWWQTSQAYCVMLMTYSCHTRSTISVYIKFFDASSHA